jgi:ABC-type uncharacterized transport system substrate-binding protein
MRTATNQRSNNSALIPQRSLLVVALCALLFALCGPLSAQQAKKIARIGFLGATSASANSARLEAFRQGLRELGYVEGKNIVIEYRYADGKPLRLPALAAELVGLNVNVIVSGGAAATWPAKQATATIPIIMTGDNDPVRSGFVASLARPGGNVTGLSTLTNELSGKRLELLKEIVPRLSRVAVMGAANTPGNEQALKDTELAAKALRLQVQPIDVLSRNDIETAFREAVNGNADAVLLLGGSVFVLERRQIAVLSVKSRLPTVHYRQEFVEDGGLMSYATSLADLSRRAAIYVDKILKGTKPADLPVEQPTKFELVINQKTAKQIGLTVPPNVLARADRVIR